MIFKKQRKQDFILGKLCLFSNEYATFHHSDDIGYIYFLYIISGSVILENSQEKKTFKSGELFDYRPYSDIVFKLTAGNLGALCICIIADISDNYTNLFDCCIINKSNKLNKNKSRIIISLTESLEISNQQRNKFIKIPPGYIVTLQSDIEYFLTHSENVKNAALLIER